MRKHSLTTPLSIALSCALVILGLLIVWPSAHIGASGTWYVRTDGSDANPCSSPALACATINQALGMAVSGDTIQVAIGSYTASAGNEVVAISKGITLSGGWSASFMARAGVATIDGQNTRRGITISAGPVYIDHFTVANGFTANALGGGGIYSNANTLISDSTLYQNSASAGGALRIDNPGALSVVNSTFAANSAGSGAGGAILNGSGAVTSLFSVTIANNTAGAGGALYNGSGGVITLRDTLLAQNTGGDCGGALTSNTYNLIGAADSCTFTAGAGDQVGSGVNPIDPKLGPYFNGVLPLLINSPAIDAADPGGCRDASNNLLATDQLGQPRLGICDIGAYELSDYSTYTPTATLTPSVTPTDTPTPSGPVDTVGVYRRSSSSFLLRLSNASGPADITIQVGGQNSYPVVGDWDADGYDTVGIFNQQTGMFTLYDSNLQGAPLTQQFVLGNSGDIPIAGRWTAGVPHDGVGVFRPSNGIIYLSINFPPLNGIIRADYSLVLGNPGDIGMSGRWKPGGILDAPAVYRPSRQRFYVTYNVCPQIGCIERADASAVFGNAGDVPFKGDWVGSGTDGISVFRPSNGMMYLRDTVTTGIADIKFPFGVSGDIPISGHWKPLGGSMPHPVIIVPRSVSTPTPFPTRTPSPTATSPAGRFD